MLSGIMSRTKAASGLIWNSIEDVFFLSTHLKMLNNNTYYSTRISHPQSHNRSIPQILCSVSKQLTRTRPDCTFLVWTCKHHCQFCMLVLGGLQLLIRLNSSKCLGDWPIVSKNSCRRFDLDLFVAQSGSNPFHNIQEKQDS